MVDPQDMLHAVEVAKEASLLNDRALFLAMLFLFIVTTFVAVRWTVDHFTERTKKLEIKIDEIQAEYVTYIKTESASNKELLNQCVTVLKRIAPIVLVCFLTSCVNIPIPPAGENAGKYGSVEIAVRYKPNFETLFSSSTLKKPTSSK